MASMTWKEFKDAVDKDLKERGIGEEIEIWYIDISFPDKDAFEKGRIGASIDDACGIAIS